MKVTIRILASLSAVFIGLSTNTKAGTSDSTTITGLSNTITLSQSPYSFDDSSVYFIVLKNNQYCGNCFSVIDDYITQIKNPGVKFVAVLSSDSGILERKKLLADSRKLLPHMDEFVFQYKADINSIFNSAGIKYTPEILIINRSRFTLIPYKEIFDFATMNISITTRQKLINLLNEN